MPRFSVIIPYYNQPEYLGDCITCLKRQTCRDWEAIIVDDGSTAAAAAEADRLADSDSRIDAIRKPNGGLASARNKGLGAAAGEFVLMLDSDDVVHPELLDTIAQAIREHDAGVIRFGWQEFDDSRLPVGRMRPSLSHRLGDRLTRQILSDRPLRRVAFTNPTPVHAQIWRREALGDRRYDESLPSNEDWDFMIRYFGDGGRVATLDATFAFYRRHGKSMNKNHARMFETKMRVAEKNRKVFETDPLAEQFLGVGLRLAEESMGNPSSRSDEELVETLRSADLSDPAWRYMMLYLGNALRGLGGESLPRTRQQARRLQSRSPRLILDLIVGGVERLRSKVLWRHECLRRLSAAFDKKRC